MDIAKRITEPRERVEENRKGFSVHTGILAYTLIALDSRQLKTRREITVLSCPRNAVSNILSVTEW